MLQALQDLRSAFGLYLLNNGVTVVLALAHYRPTGVQGIAAAVSAGYLTAAAGAAAVVRRRLTTVPVPATSG